MEGNGPEVRLNWKELQKLEVLEEVRSGRRTQRSAAETLGMTDRWVRSLLERLKAQGAAGLVHGNRNRRPWNRISEERRDEWARIYREKYDRCNLSHFRDLLIRREKRTGVPGRETLRQILLTAGIWVPRRHAPKHRLRRPRREREGELLQVDASIHAWLGPDHPPLALVGGVDDATGKVPHVQFFRAETTEAYMILIREVARQYGLPQALYSDQDSVFQVNTVKDRELLHAQGRLPLTQFGRALKELGIERITAYSPQAKGRIERLWGTFQDRLLNELRLEQIHSVSEANAYLIRKFLPAYNRQFAREAAVEDPVYRPAPIRSHMEAILCWKETRILSRDHTFSWEAQIWQVLPCSRVPALTGRRIEVRRTLRGSLEAWYGSVRLSTRTAPKTPPLTSLRRADPCGARASRAAARAYPVRGKVHL